MVRFVVVQMYHILVILVTTSIIAGIIIDTFAENRTADKAIRDDITNRCFICSLDRDVLEHHGEGFERHIARSHNAWHYLFFKVHLSQKHPDDYTGHESCVFGLKGCRCAWFHAPHHTQLCSVAGCAGMSPV